ncbi:MAG TPA: hypothetical protein VF189_03255 [Patescibacteria group bacterium]
MAAQLLAFAYIENNSLTFVGNNGGTFQLSIPTDVVRDLEVLDRDKLTMLVAQFLQANSLQPCPVVFLLSPNITFAQDIGQAQPQEVEVIIEKFLDTIPFENVGSKRVVIAGKTKVVGANKELYNTIKLAYEKGGFSVLAVVPFVLLQSTIPELATTVEPNAVFSKFDSLKQYNIISQEIIRPQNQEAPKKGLKGRRDMMLLGIFGMLMLVLIYMVLANTVFAPKAPVQNIPAGPLPSRALIFPTSTPAASPSGILQGQNRPIQPQGRAVITP